jgi:hypothetical protein
VASREQSRNPVTHARPDRRFRLIGRRPGAKGSKGILPFRPVPCRRLRGCGLIARAPEFVFGIAGQRSLLVRGAPTLRLQLLIVTNRRFQEVRDLGMFPPSDAKHTKPPGPPIMRLGLAPGKAFWDGYKARMSFQAND